MRGRGDAQSDMLCLISPESRVPKDHPLRRIKALVDEALGGLSPLFDELYAAEGRPSIPPERLLKAKVLQALYTIRSENLLIEALDYNLLFRWFLDFNLLDPVWDNSAFSKNQDRLLAHHVAEVFFARVVLLAREHGWASDAHFTVDGTLIDAWASLKSFQPKAGPKEPRDGAPGNPAVDFHGQTRSNATHASTTDPEAQLARKGKGKEARLGFGLHALMENRNGLCVQAQVTTAHGVTESTAATDLLGRQIDGSEHLPESLGADKGYHSAEVVGFCRDHAQPRLPDQPAAPQAGRGDLRVVQRGGRPAAHAQARHRAGGPECPADPHDLQPGADGQALGQSAGNGDAGTRGVPGNGEKTVRDAAEQPGRPETFAPIRPTTAKTTERQAPLAKNRGFSKAC